MAFTAPDFRYYLFTCPGRPIGSAATTAAEHRILAQVLRTWWDEGGHQQHDSASQTAALLGRVRTILGMTTRDFGELVGVSHSTISRWSKGDIPRYSSMRDALDKLVQQLSRSTLGISQGFAFGRQTDDDELLDLTSHYKKLTNEQATLILTLISNPRALDQLLGLHQIIYTSVAT